MSKAGEFLDNRFKTTIEVSKEDYHLWVRMKHAIEALELARKEEQHLIYEKARERALKEVVRINNFAENELKKIEIRVRLETAKEMLEAIEKYLEGEGSDEQPNRGSFFYNWFKNYKKRFLEEKKE